jgi:hypothetical protein
VTAADEKQQYRAYLGGPMSGLKQFNFPAFDAAAAHLREQGWDIVSPAELDVPEVREQALASPDGKSIVREKDTEQTWGDFLARDVKLIADEIQAIILLPGWSDSRGAMLESFVGLLAHKDFYLYDKMEGAQRVPRRMISETIFSSERFK